jgi:hypothetical protein
MNKYFKKHKCIIDVFIHLFTYPRVINLHNFNQYKIY